MQDSESKEIKKWIQTWEQTRLALDRVKLNELRAIDYYSRNQALLNEMLQYAFDHREIRSSSGLIEQQKIFMKLKKQMDEKNAG